MMRSVIAYLTGTTRNEVSEFLDQYYPSEAYRHEHTDAFNWIVYKDGDAVLWIGFYNDLASEGGPEEVARITRALGEEIIVSVSADVSGRHKGQYEATIFIVGLLSRFHGVAEEDLSDHLWTLQELLNYSRYQGRLFFEY